MSGTSVEQQVNLAIKEHSTCPLYLILNYGGSTDHNMWPSVISYSDTHYDKVGIIYHGSSHFVGIVKYRDGYLYFNNLHPVSSQLVPCINDQPDSPCYFENIVFVIYQRQSGMYALD